MPHLDRPRDTTSVKKFIVLAVIVAVGVGIYSQRTPLIERLLDRGIERRIAFDMMKELPDGLHVTVCGAGGPMPSPKASGACVAVVAGNQLFVVDAGTNGLRNLMQLGFPTGAMTAVLLTHFHSDHIDGLGEMATIRWVGAGNTEPLPVYGPEGVTEVVEGFNAAYRSDGLYRQAHHGDNVAPLSGHGMQAMPFESPEDGELVRVYSNGELTIDALKVVHDPVKPAVAYLFRYKDRSALVSGDTAKSENLERFADGVDLLVHEALSHRLVKMMNGIATREDNAIMAKVTFDILDYHASPKEAAETARDAGVGHLLYYHIVPPLIVPGQEALWLNGADEVFPAYTIAQDGTSFSLPAGSKDILQTRDSM